MAVPPLQCYLTTLLHLLSWMDLAIIASSSTFLPGNSG
jgi:hypothetical protein